MADTPTPSAEALEVARHLCRAFGSKNYAPPTISSIADALDAFAAQKVAEAQAEWARYDDAIRDQARAAAFEEAERIAATVESEWPLWPPEKAVARQIRQRIRALSPPTGDST